MKDGFTTYESTNGGRVLVGNNPGELLELETTLDSDGSNYIAEGRVLSSKSHCFNEGAEIW